MKHLCGRSVGAVGVVRKGDLDPHPPWPPEGPLRAPYPLVPLMSSDISLGQIVVIVRVEFVLFMDVNRGLNEEKGGVGC